MWRIRLEKTTLERYSPVSEQSMADEIIQCMNCGNPMVAQENENGDLTVLGTTECPECGCQSEDFEVVESDELGATED